MTTGRDGAHIIFCCDDCNDILYTATADWEESRAVFKEHNWVVYRFDDTWMHRCPTCERDRNPSAQHGRSIAQNIARHNNQGRLK